MSVDEKKKEFERAVFNDFNALARRFSTTECQFEWGENPDLIVTNGGRYGIDITRVMKVNHVGEPLSLKAKSSEERLCESIEKEAIARGCAPCVVSPGFGDISGLHGREGIAFVTEVSDKVTRQACAGPSNVRINAGFEESPSPAYTQLRQLAITTKRARA